MNHLPIPCYAQSMLWQFTAWVGFLIHFNAHRAVHSIEVNEGLTRFHDWVVTTSLSNQNAYTVVINKRRVKTNFHLPHQPGLVICITVILLRNLNADLVMSILCASHRLSGDCMYSLVPSLENKIKTALEMERRKRRCQKVPAYRPAVLNL